MTLLHFAATSRNGGTVAHMRRLLELGANPSAKDQIGEVPMHCCVRAPTNEEDAALAKCKLLPVADIAANTVFDWTPFRLALFTNETVLRWMLEQPGCPVEDMLYAQTVALGPVVGENIWRLVEEAAAQRRRWTPNRAAWAATVAAAAVLQP
jgi:ankyrin repeat protein